MNRLPWIKFYSRDALGDPMLRMVGPEARGIWYDMLWLMDVSERRGYLTRNGIPWPDDELCRVLAVTAEELSRSKAKLLSAGVPSVEPETGIWFNRRMVRDESKRLAGSEAGKRGGGNPSLHSPQSGEKLDARSHMPEARTPIKATFIGDGIGGNAGTDKGESEGKPPPPPPPPAKPPQAPKLEFGELKTVRLTRDEYDRVAAKEGKERTDMAIELLDGYIGSKGARYKSHYAVLKAGSWVWDRVDEAMKTANIKRVELAAAERAANYDPNAPI